MKKYDMTGLREMLEQLPTKQLDLMLQCELEKEQIDEASVRLIMDVLEVRDQDAAIELNEQIEDAWAKYQMQTPIRNRKILSFRSWPVRAAAAAAIIILMALTVVPQNAEAEGFWERLSSWTESIFEFFAPGDAPVENEYIFETDNPGLQQVYDTVTDLGVTDPVVPMWLPDGYELVECDVNESPTKIFVYACFSNEENNVILDIAIRDTESPRQYSKDEENAKTREIADIVHNILHNEEWWTAVWTRERLECAIYIDCQEETLYKILKSIYTMEAD